MISADKSKAIQNRRVCYWCALPINEPHIQICPRCGGSDIDSRRARPSKQEPRLIDPLPHPWHRLQMREGGTVILSGNKGSGKTSICLKLSPTLFISTEQEIEEVAHAWYRIMANSGVQVPIITNTYSWEQLEEDLLQLKRGDRVIVDSISQLATGPESSDVVRRVIEHVRKAGAVAVFIAQFTKDGGMLGPNMLNHMVDVVCTIPDDDLGLRRLTASKNRFGSLFAQYFTLTGNGVEEQDFPYAYSVEGSAGNYSLRLFPMKPSKFGGIFDALVDAGCLIEGYASCAIACRGYRAGFAEPSDVEWRRIFAEQHGLEWITPENAHQMILDAQQEQETELAARGRPREM